MAEQIQEKVVNPPAIFTEKAWIKTMDEYKKLYDASINDPDTFWGEKAEEFYWQKKWDKVRSYSFDKGNVFIKFFEGAGPACQRRHGRSHRHHLGGQ